ncbi:MAG: type transport system permease protein [Methanofollis sp.]|nr:type transport system permease protein [Methanofollis sp.]
MRSAGLQVIAAKEFGDHIRSRRFHLIFGIFLIIAIVGLISGVVEYHENLDQYNKMQETVTGDDQNYYSSYFSWKPSIISAFTQMISLISAIGVFLGVAMSFDLITKEKESKSLKILLSHPIYRDEVINGKALGGIAAILLALVIVFGLSLAIILIMGIVPNLEETVRILIFGGISFILIFSTFAIALFMSSIAKDSGSALVYAMIIVITLSTLVPIIQSGGVMDVIVGPAPEYPGVVFERTVPMGAMSSTSVMVSSSNDDDTKVVDKEEYERQMEEYEEASQAYWERRQSVRDLIMLVSPTSNYERIALAVTEPMYARSLMNSGDYYSFDDTRDEIPQDSLSELVELLGYLLKNIVALVVVPVAFFGLAWVRFMREDVR